MLAVSQRGVQTDQRRSVIKRSQALMLHGGLSRAIRLLSRPGQRVMAQTPLVRLMGLVGLLWVVVSLLYNLFKSTTANRSSNQWSLSLKFIIGTGTGGASAPPTKLFGDPQPKNRSHAHGLYGDQLHLSVCVSVCLQC